VVGAQLLDTGHLDDASSRYEQELRPGKAETCLRIVEKAIGGYAGIHRLLDVGCGEGGFLDRVKARGIETAGIEISSRAAAGAREKGHEVFEGSVTQPLVPPGRKFDAITMWDILEHLNEPGMALHHLLAALRPGGRTFIVTPMMGSIYDRLGRAEYALSAGRHRRLLSMCFSRDHVFRFHPKGVAAALHQIGFRDVIVKPMMMLSLNSDAYAGGRLIKSWTGRSRVDQTISRMSVAFAKAARLRNKVLIQAVAG